MPFRIERPQSRPDMPPLVFVRDPDGEFVWSPCLTKATPFDGAEADAIVRRFNLHDFAEVRGMRNTVESTHANL